MKWDPIHELAPLDFCSDELTTESERINKAIEVVRTRQADYDQAIAAVVDADPMTVSESDIVEAAKARAKLVDILQAEIAIRQECVEFWSNAMSEWEKATEQLGEKLQTAISNATERLRQAGFTTAVNDAGDVGIAASRLIQASDECLQLQDQREHHRALRPTDDRVQARQQLAEAKDQLTKILQSVTAVT